MKNPKVEPRPLTILREHKPSVDFVKKDATELRQAYLENRLPNGLKPWDSAVFVPMQVHQGLFSGLAGGQLREVVALNVPIVAALHAWTFARDIYRFDPEIAQQLIKSSLKGDIPASLLRRLPGWCVYIDTQGLGLQVIGHDMLGFFAHLDDDPRGWLELRLLFDVGVEKFLHAVPVPFKGTIETSLSSLSDSAPVPTALRTQVQEGTLERYQLVVSQALNLLLWLCSEAPDIQGKGKPEKPQVVKTKHGLREFPVSDPHRSWDVAYRYGSALRIAEQQIQEQELAAGPGGEGRKSPRPHVRVPHWNTYWTGPKTGEQTPVLRWIPPVRVNFKDAEDDLPAVIHRVQE